MIDRLPEGKVDPELLAPLLPAGPVAPGSDRSSAAAPASAAGGVAASGAQAAADAAAVAAPVPGVAAPGVVAAVAVAPGAADPASADPASADPGAGVIIGAALGEDAAVVAGAPRLVFTSDPVTMAATAPGRYAVAVNCNDLVAMGAEPRYLTTTVLLPPGSTATDLSNLFAELAAAAAAAGVAWVGGHTEVTRAVTCPVVVGAAVGVLECAPWSSAAARRGDLVVLTKWVALEGSTLLARERADAAAILGADYAAVVGWLDEPGISVIAEGRVLRQFPIHAAHDPTEGGVAQGIHELARCSGVAIEVDAAALPVRPATRRLCQALGIDPLGLLASGALLFTAPPAVARAAVAALQAAAIPATVIGSVRAGSGGTLRIGADTRPLPAFPQDELSRLGGAGEQHG